jgi:transcriptional regulator with PAS, ATPase and Fis domain
MSKDRKRFTGDQTRTEVDRHLAQSERQLRLVIVLEGKVITEALPRSGEVIVGRGAGCNIEIVDPGISRRHFMLRIGAETTVTDLGSKNGITVRGRRVERNHTVSFVAGDVLQAGRVLVLLQNDLAAAAPEKQPAATGPVIVEGGSLAQLWELTRRAAKTPISVLIVGETGVGKEVFAEAIHRFSPRANMPFFRLNCAALPEALLESELFGFERGAFTGAAQRKLGLLEVAHGGSVFFDELGEMPLGVQAKLLQVIEEKLVRRIGALKSQPIDVRFISATNRDLEEAVARGTFRRDLLFRLNGMSFVVPPLRERPDELEPLARTFIEARYEEFGLHAAPPLTDEAVAAMRDYGWPGNVRELKNVIDRALVMSQGGPISAADLQLEARGDGATRETALPPAALGELGDSDDAAALKELLARFAGNQSRAARALGIARSTLIARMERFGIPRPRK